MWQGDLIVSTLKTKSLYRLRIEDGRVIYEEPILVGQKIRDIEALASGDLLAATDSRNLLIISDAGEIYGKPRSTEEIRRALPVVVVPSGQTPDREAAGAADGPLALGRAIFEEACAACHRLDGAFDVSVPLDGLFGRRIGSVAGYDYSRALAADRRSWNVGLLKRFLIARDGSFAGTSMPKVSLRSEEVDALAAYLADRP